jgi:hypothetical protein
MDTVTDHNARDEDGYSWAEHQALLDKVGEGDKLTEAEYTRLMELDALL